MIKRTLAMLLVILVLVALTFADVKIDFAKKIKEVGYERIFVNAILQLPDTDEYKRMVIENYLDTLCSEEFSTKANLNDYILIAQKKEENKKPIERVNSKFYVYVRDVAGGEEALTAYANGLGVVSVKLYYDLFTSYVLKPQSISELIADSLIEDKISAKLVAVLLKDLSNKTKNTIKDKINEEDEIVLKDTEIIFGGLSVTKNINVKLNDRAAMVSLIGKLNKQSIHLTKNTLVLWYVENPEIATVYRGVITPKAVGKTKVHIYFGGVENSFTVTVKE